MSEIKLQKIDNYRWKIPRSGKMLTDGLIYASEKMINAIKNDQSLVQVANVACLPGIIGCSLAMPDIHWGYGFPIGGVAAFDIEHGIVSPGGVGYDINCGVRLIRSNLEKDDIKKHINDLVNALFRNIPTGLGSQRKDLKLSPAQLGKVLMQGAKWVVSKGFGNKEDLLHIEEGGCLDWAKVHFVSNRARERGKAQLGTLGSGNHFVEIGYVNEIYDDYIANKLGLFINQVTVIVHTGSRGLGHQVCDDYIRVLLKAAQKHRIELPDKQLCCTPIKSKEGQEYLGAMAAAVNFAFANRQIITHWIRDTFEQTLHLSPNDLGLELIYDVCHNIAKFEKHFVNGKKTKVCVHRKGATRAFPAYHPQVPDDYKDIGQPVLIPGDMGRYSYVLVGTEKAMQETFGSTCHGAGRIMSRHQAKKYARGHDVLKELEDKEIIVKGAGMGTVVEEISAAYKDVEDVVEVVHQAGISKKVAKLVPLGVIKG